MRMLRKRIRHFAPLRHQHSFFEGVAITLFGASSPAVLVTIVGVLVEVPVMLFLVKIANSTASWFPEKVHQG